MRELFGEFVSLTAAPGSVTVQDRFAVGGETEGLRHDARGSKSRG